jgi:hypothetical protein
MIQEHFKARKAPGYDLITGIKLKELPRNDVSHLTSLCNSIIRTGPFPAQWKVAQIIRSPKPGKLPITSKIFGKAMLKRLRPISEKK